MLRNFLFRLFKPRDKYEAYHLRRRIALLYAFLGWNCFGVAFYVIMKKQIPEDSQERRLAYRLLGGVPDKMHVYQVKGLTLTNDFNITYKSDDQKEIENTESENAIIQTDKH